MVATALCTTASLAQTNQPLATATKAETAVAKKSADYIDLTLYNESVALKWNANSAGRITSYRLLRTVEPDLGWEEIAEIAKPDAEGNFTAKDENPLPGRVFYKLQSKTREGEWRTIDVQTVNRNLGTAMEQIDFFANNRGELIISRNQMPEDLSLVQVYDLQGGNVEAPVKPFGNFVKIDVSSLSFGVYMLQMAVEDALVSKYFLACGLD